MVTRIGPPDDSCQSRQALVKRWIQQQSFSDLMPMTRLQEEGPAGMITGC